MTVHSSRVVHSVEEEGSLRSPQHGEPALWQVQRSHQSTPEGGVDPLREVEATTLNMVTTPGERSALNNLWRGRSKRRPQIKFATPETRRNATQRISVPFGNSEPAPRSLAVDKSHGSQRLRRSPAGQRAVAERSSDQEPETHRRRPGSGNDARGPGLNRAAQRGGPAVIRDGNTRGSASSLSSQPPV